jgi:hypothetical protein
MSLSIQQFSVWKKTKAPLGSKNLAKLAWQEAWIQSRNNTLLEILTQCELRGGRRCTQGGMVPMGGGLYALEQIAQEDSAFPKVFYERQRIEIEHLAWNIYKQLIERKRDDNQLP